MNTENPYITYQILNGISEKIDYSGFRDLRKHAELEEFYTGDLIIESGQIVVTDPILLYNDTPLEKRVQKGHYPVYLYYKPTQFGKRIFYAMLEFQNEIPSQWEYALMDNAYLEEKDKKLNGYYAEDAGLLSFSDGETNINYQNEYLNYLKSHKNKNYYDNVLAAHFTKNGNTPPGTFADGDWVNYHLKDSRNENIIMFRSGMGDGIYPAYWGLDSLGNAVQLVIDFQTEDRVEMFKEVLKRQNRL